MKPLRLSDNGIVGTVQKIESQVKLPETRIQATPETGTESCSGALSSEWNIDEQDELIAAAMCSDWKDVELSETETENGFTEKKELTLGTERAVFQVLKKYNQAPVEYQLFKGVQVNEMTITMALNSFVTLSFGCLGANHPTSVTESPLPSGVTLGAALTTKSFKTLEGYIKIGDDFETLSAMRQCPNFSLSINNNKERTDALFETEAVEMSDGDFVLTGSVDIWKAGDVARELSNAGIKGKDKCIEVQLSRTVGNVKSAYTIMLKVHLDDSQEAKDGNKLKNTIPFSLNSADGIKFVKTVQTV